MCKFGDIIVINRYIGEDGKLINKHSFVVINDKPGFVEGLYYDFVSNVMSSFKNEEHRMKKLKLKENIEITSNQIISNIKRNSQSGYIKADQLMYFDKSKIDYYVLGHITDDLMDELIMIIVSLFEEGILKRNINNLVN